MVNIAIVYPYLIGFITSQSVTASLTKLWNFVIQVGLLVYHFPRAYRTLTHNGDSVMLFMKFETLLSIEKANKVMDTLGDLISYPEDGGVFVRIPTIESFAWINLKVLRMIIFENAVSLKPKINKQYKVKVSQQLQFLRFLKKFNYNFGDEKKISTSKWTCPEEEPDLIDGFYTFIITVDDVSLAKIEASNRVFESTGLQVFFEAIN